MQFKSIYFEIYFNQRFLAENDSNLKANSYKIYFKVDLAHSIKIMNSRSCGGSTLKKNTLFQGGIVCECRLRCMYSAHVFNNSFGRVLFSGYFDDLLIEILPIL